MKFIYLIISLSFLKFTYLHELTLFGEIESHQSDIRKINSNNGINILEVSASNNLNFIDCQILDHNGLIILEQYNVNICSFSSFKISKYFLIKIYNHQNQTITYRIHFRESK